MQAREVYIKSDGNSAPLKVMFEGQTFGELKAATQGQVSWDNSVVRVKGSKVDLVDAGAFIPAEGPVMIFVVPQKQKGGAVSRSEILSRVRAVVAADSDARAYFGNASQTSTAVLLDRLATYNRVSSIASSAVRSVAISTIEDTEEMQNVRTAFQDAVDALNVLGGLVIKGEDSYGGTTLAELNAEYKTVA
jgi:predicted transcriptional regulator